MTEILTANPPSDWTLYRLGQVFDDRKEKASDKEFDALSVTMKGIVPQLETAAKTDDGDNRKLVRKGDYVINSRSDRKGSGGISPLDGTVSLISIVLKPRTGIVPEFAHHLLRSPAFQEEFYRWGHGIVADLWTTRYSDMKNIRFFLPALPTQKRVAAFLDRETARIDVLISKKEHLVIALNAKLRTSITSAVTSGIDAAAEMLYSGTDWIGEVPYHWTVTKLGYLGRFANGINIGGGAFGSGHPFYSYGDVYKNRILPEVASGLVQSSEIDRTSYTVRTGDVFFTRTSETIEEVGFSSVCMETVDDAVFAGFLIRFRPRPGQLNPSFSKYAFQHSGLRDYFAKEMNLITRASLSQDLLRNMPVALPPLDEQEAIARHLTDLETSIGAIIEKTTATIIKLKERRAALITAAVTGQIDVDTYGKTSTTSATLDQIEKEMQA